MVFGKGAFGEVKQAIIHKLGITVAAKVMNKERSPKNIILAEVIVGMALSAHPNFPYCFGLLNSDTILMELFRTNNNASFDVCPTLSKKLRTGIVAKELKQICHAVLTAISFMHLKQLLHNDLKADNIVLAGTVKIIDFGKATMASNPVIYNVRPGTTINEKYNRDHRHLAHELRNIPGSGQSCATDTYSIGYLFKHSGAIVNYMPLVELGRMMKRVSPSDRLSIENAMEKILIM